ncbi:MAG: sigma-70 family RNA polymerase sigma factor [Fuerstiella sp.]
MPLCVHAGDQHDTLLILPKEYRNSGPSGAAGFATTRWSIVNSAGQTSSPDSRVALESLCQAYWFPLYAYVRKRVDDVEEAHDLTQAFFQQLLAKNYLADADPERGRFRSFLITAFKHFLSKEWEKARAEKRGGGRRVLSLDFQVGDSRISQEPACDLTAEQIYERQWAMTLLERVTDRLQHEYEEAGKGEQFEHLKDFIIGQYSETTYADVAAQLASTEAAMKMTAHRMRRRYREILREEIAEIVATPEDVDTEIRSLFALFQN